MITFGLTGGNGSGKSTVALTFEKHGFPMIDADLIARQVVEPGTQGLSSIIDAFGSEYLQEDGSLDRIKLGHLVFSNRDSLLKLEKIVKPLIDEEAGRQIELAHQTSPIVGWNAALIIESGNADKFRPLIVVYCQPEMQLSRLMKRNDLSEEQAMARINAQMATKQKLQVADYSINTSGTIEESIKQPETIISKLKGKKL